MLVVKVSFYLWKNYNEGENMNYEDKKIVAILATNVDPKTAMNVIGHLAISIGKYSDNEIMGKKNLVDNLGKLGIDMDL